MLAEMPIQFKWDWDQLKDISLWLRATLILSSIDQQESRVVRCHVHRVDTDPSNKGNLLISVSYQNFIGVLLIVYVLRRSSKKYMCSRVEIC